MSRGLLDFVVRSAVTWLFRTRHLESRIFLSSVVILVTLHSANWAFKYSGPMLGMTGSVEIGTGGTVPDGVLWGLSVLCALLMVGSVFWGWKRYVHEQQRFARKKVLVIEGRGLRDDDGSPLKAAIPDNLVGTRVEFLLDLRQRKDGIIAEPEDLLNSIHVMKMWFHQAQRGSDRSDITTIYGGLTAVPLTFLTGLLLDDEGNVIVMDWDRTTSEWRLLDGPDDNLRFDVSGIDELHGASEVVLAVSASYMVRTEDLATTFTHPIVRMTMHDFQSSHWSPVKQSAMADQFFGVLKQLDALGVERIHLVLAAQNSVVFNLARRYDKRNLPKVTVYQFERGQNPRYPWGIEMPVAAVTAPCIVYVRRI